MHGTEAHAETAYRREAHGIRPWRSINVSPPARSLSCPHLVVGWQASYLRLVAKDVRARVSKDPDASADRFPGIASKILA